MKRENPYQTIETQLREQLRIAEICEIRDMILTPTGPLDYRSDALHRLEALSKAKKLLDKLPENYRAAKELSQKYGELI